MTDDAVVEVGDHPTAISAEHDPAVVLSLVVPTYNEAGNIEPLLRSLHGVLTDSRVGFEILVVDDDSPDRTWEVAGNLAAELPGIRVIRRTGASGLATAVTCGWAHARGEILGVIDGDGQHPPAVVADLLDAMADRTDVAVASRHVPGGGVSNWSALRRLLSRGAQALGLLLLPGTVGRVTDPMSGYFLVRRDVIAGTDLDPVGYKILLEVLARGDVRRVAERPYVFLERERGESKVSAGHYVGYLRHLMRLRLHPLRSRALVRYLVVTALALLADALAFLWIFDVQGWNLTRSAAIGPRPNQFTRALMTSRRRNSSTPSASCTPARRRNLSSELRAALPAKVQRSWSRTVRRMPTSPAMAAERVRFQPCTSKIHRKARASASSARAVTTR